MTQRTNGSHIASYSRQRSSRQLEWKGSVAQNSNEEAIKGSELDGYTQLNNLFNVSLGNKRDNGA